MATPEEIEARLAAVEARQQSQAFAQDELLARQTTIAEFYGNLAVKLDAGHKLLVAVRADQSAQYTLLRSMENQLGEHTGRLERLEAGLAGQGERLGRVEGRLEGVEGRLEGVEGRLEGVEGRLEGVEGRLEGVEGRLGGVQTDVKEILTLLKGGAAAPA